MDALTLVRKSRTYQETVARFEEIATTFAETGVAVIEGVDFSGIKNWREARKKHREEGLPIPEQTFRKFARWLAKDLGRPLLIAESCGWSNNIIRLTIPRLKRHEVIVAQFLIIEDQQNMGRYSNPPEDVCVWRRQNGSNWEIYFAHDKGKRLFAGFLDQCRYEPTFRLALKNNLPRPLPPEVTQQAA